jgi:dihydropyrimidinase
MTQAPYDLVIRGGTVASGSGTYLGDVGVRDGVIAALGLDLDPGRREIDVHCHIEQVSAAGLLNADTWESATASAAFGGTTTVVAFAAQHQGMELPRVVEDYMALARRGALVDYAFHMIVSDPTPALLSEHLPALIAAGHRSIKAFMTYERIRLGDEALLDVMLVAREHGALVCAHAENHGMIAWMSRRLLERGHAAPRFHAVSHPRVSEVEAFERLMRMSALLDQPVMIFHVSTREGAAAIRRARGQGLKIHAETCPQYLFLEAADLDRPGLEGAKWMCSPPPRTRDDQEALWRALELGDVQVVSSDHAPYRFDASGKLSGGEGATFKEIANGLPGLEARLPLLFDAMVSKGRLGLERFVEVACAAPARLHGLAPRKGAIAVGADADVAVWDPERRVTLGAAMMHDRTGYTPYEGRTVQGWPVTVVRRGEVVVEEGALEASPGSGLFLPREPWPAIMPTGRLEAEMDPARNGGAALL